MRRDDPRFLAARDALNAVADDMRKAFDIGIKDIRKRSRAILARTDLSRKDAEKLIDEIYAEFPAIEAAIVAKANDRRDEIFAKLHRQKLQ